MRVSIHTGRAVQPPKFLARRLQLVMFGGSWLGRKSTAVGSRKGVKLTEARREREPFQETRTPVAGLNTGTDYARSRDRGYHA